MTGCAKQPGFRVADDMHRNLRQHLGESPFRREGSHKGRILQEREYARRYASAEIDASGRQHFQRQIAGFAAQDGDEQSQG